MNDVVWHDLECGGYTEDLGLWRELAARHGDPVLDIGAGTGRVSLALARTGFQVVAVDIDPVLLRALTERAGDLPIEMVRADARELALGRRFPLGVVPMQTVQLLGDATVRQRFLRRVREHLLPGGMLAIAIITSVEEFEWQDGDAIPLPDIVELGGTVYSSQPTVVRGEGRTVLLERRREAIHADGTRAVEDDRIVLHSVSVDELQREGQRAGLRPAGVRDVAATDEHVGSRVVLLAAAPEVTDV